MKAVWVLIALMIVAGSAGHHQLGDLRVSSTEPDSEPQRPEVDTDEHADPDEGGNSSGPMFPPAPNVSYNQSIGGDSNTNESRTVDFHIDASGQCGYIVEGCNGVLGSDRCQGPIPASWSGAYRDQ